MTRHYLDHWLTAPTTTACSFSATPPTIRTSASPKTSSCSSSATLSHRHRPAQRGRDAAVVRRHPVDAVGGGAAAPVRRRRCDIPGYLVWAALIYAVVGTLLTHLDRLAAGRAEFPPAALRGRFPLQSRARARELRADRAARRRAGGNATACSTASARSSSNWLEIMTRAEEADLLHRGLSQVSIIFPYHRGQPGLFRRRGAARRADADRVRLRQRAERAVVLHHVLSHAGGMARGDRSGSPASTPRSTQRAGRGGDAAVDRGRGRREAESRRDRRSRCSGCRTARRSLAGDDIVVSRRANACW